MKTRFVHWWYKLQAILFGASPSAETPKEEKAFNIYKPEERLIFGYFTGEKVIYVDPIIIHQQIMAVGPELDVDIKVANSISKDASKAFKEAVVKVRAVFNVKPYAEGGLTDGEVMDLLAFFLTYCAEVKKKVSLSQTSSKEVFSPTLASVKNVSATTSSSDSGSTADAPCTSAPEPSPLVQGLPSDSLTQD